MQSMVRYAAPGEDMTLKCPYPASSVNGTKYFYRKEKISACPELASTLTQGSSVGPQSARYALVEDKAKYVATVTIRNVTPGDGGVYWCGVRSAGVLGGVAMTTELQLHTDTPKTGSTATVLGVLIPLLLLALLLIALVVYRRRRRKRQTPVSTIRLAASPTARVSSEYVDVNPKVTHQCDYDDVGCAVKGPDLYESVDPVYLNQSPEPKAASSPPSKSFQQSQGRKPASGPPSENVYQSLDAKTMLEDSVYQTLETEP
ncbi:CMRF35-like molecule 1 [Engraulis encrasicolus]|uniref:CMRF35-like molecule 1 n=1 Tax=Engraulis encrasicolus TaxID=184585 RepID=UPI002FD5E0FB